MDKPTEAEQKLAEEITKTIGLMYWKGKTKNEDVVNAIVPILAAHRTDDAGELAKALEECIGAHGDRENFILTCANVLRNAELEPGEDWDARMMHIGELHDTVEAIGHARAALARHAGKGEK